MRHEKGKDVSLVRVQSDTRRRKRDKRLSLTGKNKTSGKTGRSGIEPLPSESKPDVLPLHHLPKGILMPPQGA